MSLVRLAARPMLASVFVVQGINKLRAPDKLTERAKPVTDRLTPLLQQHVPQVPSDARSLIRISGAVDFGAGLMLATGRLPRIASLMLAASLVPATATHQFWNVHDPDEKAAERTQFLKDLALAGGLLLAGVDTAGRPSLGWRARHAAAGTRKAARSRSREARLAARAARAETSRRMASALRR